MDPQIGIEPQAEQRSWSSCTSRPRRQEIVPTLPEIARNQGVPPAAIP